MSTQIVPSSDTRPDTFSVLARFLTFPGTRPDSTIFGYAKRLYPLPILVRTLFRYSQGFYLFPVLVQILLFLGEHTDCTLFRYSSGQCFDTRTNSTFSRYSPIFNFWVRKKIVPSSDTRPDSISILTRILPFPGTHPDSTIFGYSQRLYLLPILVRTVFRYSDGFYLFPVLAPILPFLGTHTDCTLFRISSG